MTNWPVLTEHEAIFLWFSHHMLLLLFSWDLASQSESQLLVPRWTLTNEKLSCWDHGTAFTGSHTKPPIMPCFSECPSVLFIIQRSAPSKVIQISVQSPNLKALSPGLVIVKCAACWQDHDIRYTPHDEREGGSTIKMHSVHAPDPKRNLSQRKVQSGLPSPCC